MMRPDHVSMTRPAPVVELTAVSCTVDGVNVLDGRNLTVDAGEVVAVVGDEGTGKTTLLLVAIGALRPDRGRVRLAGIDPYALDPPDRRAHLRRCVAWWACQTAEAKAPVAVRAAPVRPRLVVADEPQMVYGPGRPTLRARIEEFATDGAAVIITTRPGLRTGFADREVELT